MMQNTQDIITDLKNVYTSATGYTLAVIYDIREHYIKFNKTFYTILLQQ